MKLEHILFSKYFPNLLIIGLDISPYAIKRAKHQYSSRNIIYLALDLPNKQSLEILRSRINDSGFDIIFTRDVLEHIPIKKHQLYLKAFASLLKSNGIVIARTPIIDAIILAYIVDRTRVGLEIPSYWKSLISK